VVTGVRQRRQGPGTATVERGSAATVGFWAAALASALTVAFVVLALVVPGEDWAGVEAYARAFATIEVVQLIPVLLLAPVVVVLMACIHELAPAKRRLFARIAVMFAAAYAAIIATNYVLQLFVVRLHLAAGDYEGLELLAMPNPRSVFVALEIAGYGFFSLMALFAAGAVTGPPLARWIRGLLVATGVTGIAGAVGGLTDLRLVMLTGFGLSLLAFLAGALLLCAHFRRVRPAAAGAVPGGDVP
jgi:hypothetical protein